jgi:hypothetical protein
MLDVLVAAEHFCSIVSVSIPFLLFEMPIIEKIRISFVCDISKIPYLLCSELEKRRAQIPQDG